MKRKIVFKALMLFRRKGIMQQMAARSWVAIAKARDGLGTDACCFTTVNDGLRLMKKTHYNNEFIVTWSFNFFFLSQYSVNNPSLGSLGFKSKFQLSSMVNSALNT